MQKALLKHSDYLTPVCDRNLYVLKFLNQKLSSTNHRPHIVFETADEEAAAADEEEFKPPQHQTRGVAFFSGGSASDHNGAETTTSETETNHDDDEEEGLQAFMSAFEGSDWAVPEA